MKLAWFYFSWKSATNCFFWMCVLLFEKGVFSLLYFVAIVISFNLIFILVEEDDLKKKVDSDDINEKTNKMEVDEENINNEVKIENEISESIKEEQETSVA